MRRNLVTTSPFRRGVRGAIRLVFASWLLLCAFKVRAADYYIDQQAINLNQPLFLEKAGVYEATEDLFVNYQSSGNTAIVIAVPGVQLAFKKHVLANLGQSGGNRAVRVDRSASGAVISGGQLYNFEDGISADGSLGYGVDRLRIHGMTFRSTRYGIRAVEAAAFSFQNNVFGEFEVAIELTNWFANLGVIAGNRFDFLDGSPSPGFPPSSDEYGLYATGLWGVTVERNRLVALNQGTIRSFRGVGFCVFGRVIAGNRFSENHFEGIGSPIWIAPTSTSGTPDNAIVNNTFHAGPPPFRAPVNGSWQPFAVFVGGGIDLVLVGNQVKNHKHVGYLHGFHLTGTSVANTGQIQFYDNETCGVPTPWLDTTGALPPGVVDPLNDWNNCSP